jgi:hypothetical protein
MMCIYIYTINFFVKLDLFKYFAQASNNRGRPCCDAYTAVSILLRSREQVN